jgi:hypothetical protein
MKERPIIFNAEMVRAVLDGRKTQTRRIIQSPAKNMQARGHECISYRAPGDQWYQDYVFSMRDRSGVWQDYKHEQFLAKCPFGAIGDRLWVRETWMPDAPRDGTWGDVEFYGCKGSPLSIIPERYRKPEHCIHRASWDGSEMVGWTPSIHMPRWASRITLEITGVRVERLQDISQSDAKSEGCWYGRGGGEPDFAVTPSDHFPTLWASIYGEENWQANPWVWVIEFKRVEVE